MRTFEERISKGKRFWDDNAHLKIKSLIVEIDYEIMCCFPAAWGESCVK